MQIGAQVKEPSIRRHNRRDAHGVIRSGRGAGSTTPGNGV
jgi:hypothetical protein